MKKNVPVIIFKEIVFLPHKKIKLEIDNEESKNIINTSLYFNNAEILIISENNNGIGVLSKITKKETLKNGNMNIEITGIIRAHVTEYLKQTTEILESIIEEIPVMLIEEKIEKKLVKNLKDKIKEYTEKVPSVSNGVIELIRNKDKLSDVVDIAANNLQIKNLRPFLEELSPIKRMNILLEYIHKEITLYEIELEANNKVEENIKKENEEYFIKEKIKQLQKEIKKDTKKTSLEDKVKNKNIPENIKLTIDKELSRYEELSEMSVEKGNVKNYIDWLLAIPWGIYTEDNKDMNDVRKKLNKYHYSLDKGKERIMEFLAVKSLNDKIESPIICLVGPPGVGKTTLAKSIATALNRNFVKMSVGGVNDEGEILGHRRTYLESRPGKIVNLLIKSKCMNPVFLIDEIDKMVRNSHGDPISTLLEVLDTNQNNKFTDAYLEEEIDLSSVFFITTANDINQIPNELKDRLEFIYIDGYTLYEKLEIVRGYIIPNICQKYGILEDKISFENKAIYKVINEYTKEMGIRELERKIEEIIRKIITELVIYKNSKNKYYITENIIQLYLGTPIYPIINTDEKNLIGVANAIAYTSYGGEVIKVESTYFKGNGKLILTGTLGEIIKESAMISLSYLRANASKFNIDVDMLNTDIHIHMPNGAEKKDGPSAGVSITTSLLSILTKKKISNKIAFIGEMTLSGKIISVGKIKEKIMSAYKYKIKTVILPIENKKEILLLPKEISETLEFVYVDNYQDVYNYLNTKTNKRKNKKSKNINQKVTK